MTRILFITNPELGQLQVTLAVAHSIIEQDPAAEIHLATYQDARASITIANANAYAGTNRTARKKRPFFVLHEIAGVPWADAVRSHSPSGNTLVLPSLLHKPTIWTWSQHLREVGYFFQPWTGPQLVEVYRSVVHIVKTVNPDVAVVDSMNLPGNIACRHLGVKWCILTPSSLKDWAGAAQPGGRMFWKYPAMGSGFPYPMAWYQVPVNACFVLLMLFHMLKGDPEGDQVAAFFEKHTDGASIRLDRAPNPFVSALVGILPELDYPLQVIPENILPCGPIVRPSPPVAQSAPQLARWLARGHTVYVNLGSHCAMSETQACEFAVALKMLFDEAKLNYNRGTLTQDLQVLWKLKKEDVCATETLRNRAQDVLEEELKSDRVRIVDWIECEPISILESGRVILSVHHGGANSFAEAIIAGVPQVVLTQWVDTFDYASRVELIGVGRRGNKSLHSGWESTELGNALIDAILGRDANKFTKTARDIAELSARDGGGRALAARYLRTLASQNTSYT